MVKDKNVLYIPKEDLADPEKLLFEARTPVEFRVRGAKTIKTKKKLPQDVVILELVVLSGEHMEKVHTLFIRKDMTNDLSKRNYIAFVKAFYTVDEISSGKANLSNIINHKIEVSFGAAKEYKGDMYQNAYGYTDLGEVVDDTITTTPTATTTTAATKAETIMDEDPIF